ncbi:AraC family transcriptional regulator [Fluviicola sp.]|uniref:helix-turn-helix domain-containing protein n=1 Tax=Fluviicola sp. TaxID=1917219 RepID=UPI0031D7C4AB
MAQMQKQVQQEAKPAENLFGLFNHVSTNPVLKNRIDLQQNLITLVEQGEKVVHYANSRTTITDAQFILLSSGNCLMSEKFSKDRPYRSTLLFFENAALTRFFTKYASLISRISPDLSADKKPFVVFEKDEFIRNYIQSLKFINQETPGLSEQKIALKFEELMLYLLENYPKELLSFQIRSQEEYSDLEIRKAVEQNITSNLTLEELAFLCHTSVSTFKRRFQKLYQLTPRQYFLQQKMELAATFLLENDHPGEVFYKVGYENHSSFSQSFKQVYGVSPKEFQQQKRAFSDNL